MQCPLSQEQIMSIYGCSREVAQLVSAYFRFGFIPAGSPKAEAEAQRIVDDM